MVTCALLAIAVALMVTGAILVAVLHLKFEPVLSGSMRPGIQPGDLAVIRPVPVEELKAGDVIAYLPPRRTAPVLHRIVSINADGVVTRGDANNAADPWGRVKPHDVTVERLVTTLPKVGFLADIKQLLLIIAGALLVLVAVMALWPDRRDPRGTEPCDFTGEREQDHNGSVDGDLDVYDRSAMEIHELTTNGRVST